MTQELNLYGGPWHGRVIVIPDGSDHFHVVGPDVAGAELIAAPNGDEAVAVPVREGSYSRVGSSKTDFEWDGWIQ